MAICHGMTHCAKQIYIIIKGHSRTVSGCSRKKMSDCAQTRIFFIFQGGAENLKANLNYFMV